MNSFCQTKVSVIVPIYNVEKYIERCVRSLMEQTLDNIEYIFINDATPDRSMEVLNCVINEYPLRLQSVNIINNEKNMGLAFSRKTGMLLAHGKYIISCDSDDWIEPNMYESLYNLAIETNSDVVMCDFINEYDDHYSIETFVEIVDFRKEALKASGVYWWSVVNRLVKSEIIKSNNIYPIEGVNYTEDLNTMMRIYYHSNKISHIHVPLYHYNRTNETSLVHKDILTNIPQHAKSLEYLYRYFLSLPNTTEIIKLLKLSHIALRDTLLASKTTKKTWKLWARTLPYTYEFVQENPNLSKLYKLLYSNASKGFISPFKFYLWLGKLKHGLL